MSDSKYFGAKDIKINKENNFISFITDKDVIKVIEKISTDFNINEKDVVEMFIKVGLANVIKMASDFYDD